MTTIIFTRYLYNADEVQLTFLECLLTARNLEECYFWIYEYGPSREKCKKVQAYVRIKFNDKLENENSEEGVQNFIGELANSLTLDDSIDNLIKSKYF